MVTSFTAGIMTCFTGKQKHLKRGAHRQHTYKSSELKDWCSPTEYLSEQLCWNSHADPSASLFLLALFPLTEAWQAASAFLEPRNKSGLLKGTHRGYFWGKSAAHAPEWVALDLQCVSALSQLAMPFISAPPRKSCSQGLGASGLQHGMQSV